MDNKLTDPNFIEQCKSKPQDFTRKRSFSFKSLSLFIISSLQSSIQRELDRFFKSYNDKDVPERFVTQSAFSQARYKIKPEAFIELNNDIVQHFYSEYTYKTWKGHRLIAIDGSEIKLPKNAETIAEYGEHQTNLMPESGVMARISKSYDVLNNITIDTKLANRKVGEHTLAKGHLDLGIENDLYLFDRGYPSFDLFREVLINGGHFCARVAISNWNASKELIETGEKEKVAFIKPGYNIRKKYKAAGIEIVPMECRFILVELPNGGEEVLITSLLNKDEYPNNIFKWLYHQRWAVEESYKKDKIVLQFENFSGFSKIAIEQDFYATILLGNLTSILSFNIEIVPKKRKRKYQYQVNVTSALSKVKGVLALLFTKQNIINLLERLMVAIASNILPVRPNRSFERASKRDRHRAKQRRNYKRYMTL